MQFLPFRRPPFYMPLKKRTDLVQQKSGRALCHCFAGRFHSAAFCTFGGGWRRFGRRFHPLPVSGGGRRQRQPSAFRLSSVDRSAAIRHRRQRPGVLAELRQCGGWAVAIVGIVVLVSVCIYSTAGVCGAFLVGGSLVGAMWSLILI